jgi:selenoprotein W-related protein
LAAKLESDFGAETLLVEGAGGIFDVVVDGDLVYSKHQTGEFPDEDALAESLKRRP